METTHVLVARTAALERALAALLQALGSYHPDGLPDDLREAAKAASEVLDD